MQHLALAGACWWPCPAKSCQLHPAPSHPSPLPPPRDLEERAKEYHISDTASFYASDMFKSSGFKLDPHSTNISFAMA